MTGIPAYAAQAQNWRDYAQDIIEVDTDAEAYSTSAWWRREHEEEEACLHECVEIAEAILKAKIDGESDHELSERTCDLLEANVRLLRVQKKYLQEKYDDVYRAYCRRCDNE
jgi:NTP pyrophosphatase (non-canonical NTP hydrolase)